MKTAVKCDKDEFLVISLKELSGFMVVVIHPRTPKVCAIAYENGHKHGNNELLDKSLEYLSGLTIVVNHPRTPKMWAIAHENDEFMFISLKHVYRVLQ